MLHIFHYMYQYHNICRIIYFSWIPIALSLRKYEFGIWYLLCCAANQTTKKQSEREEDEERKKK